MICTSCGWRKFADELADMAEDGRYRWAANTLMAIRTTVLQQQHATENQSRAVENIRRRVEGY